MPRLRQWRTFAALKAQPQSKTSGLIVYLFLRSVAVPVGEISNTDEPDLSVSSIPSKGIAEVAPGEARPPVPWHQPTLLNMYRYGFCWLIMMFALDDYTIFM